MDEQRNGQLLLQLVKLQARQTQLAVEQTKLTRALYGAQTVPRKGPQPERLRLVRKAG